MDQIPRHVLYHIFKDLHYQQKKECKRVCRSWAQCLQSGLELRTISLLEEAESHAFVRSLKGPATSCKQLVLNQCKPLAKLVALFPKLQFAAFIDDDERSDDEEEENGYADYTPEGVGQFDGWYQHLETFIGFRYSHEMIIEDDDEYPSYCQSMYAFTAHKYPKLEYLTLPTTTLDASLYLSIACGMSNLKQLQLVFVEEEWETGEFDATLNTLVNDLPASLETLGLSCCVLSVDSEQPAQWCHSSLKRLELHECVIKEDLSSYSNRK